MKRLLPLLMLGTFCVSQAQAGVAVKNFRQIYESLAVSTGVAPDDYDILQYYTQSFTRLPMTGAVAEVSSPALLTTTALAGLFCKKMIATDSKLSPNQRRAHAKVDFTKGPGAFFPQVQQAVIEAYFGLFLSRSPSQAEFEILKGEFAEVTQVLGNTAADTLTALLPVCTTVASSLESLLI